MTVEQIVSAGELTRLIGEILSTILPDESPMGTALSEVDEIRRQDCKMLARMVAMVLDNSRSSVIDDGFEFLDAATQDLVNEGCPNFVAWTER